MPSDAPAEAALLADIDADLVQLNEHVNRWIADRFLDSESPAGLTLEDVSGLIAWLQQWHAHFDTYAEAAVSLIKAGSTAVAERLTQIEIEIDNSIATFTQMAAGLPDQAQ